MQITLEFLKIVFSPQIVTAGTLLILVWYFRADLRKLMARLSALRVPWMEITAPVPQADTDSMGKEAAGKALAEPEKPAVKVGVPMTQKNLEDLERLLKRMHDDARFWEFRFLNYFLVPMTQLLLDWIATQPEGAHRDFLTASWIRVVPDQGQRDVMLDVLIRHGLVTYRGEVFRVTDKGREYLSWRGPIPMIPPTWPAGPVGPRAYVTSTIDRTMAPPVSGQGLTTDGQTPRQP